MGAADALPTTGQRGGSATVWRGRADFAYAVKGERLEFVCEAYHVVKERVCPPKCHWGQCH